MNKYNTSKTLAYIGLSIMSLIIGLSFIFVKIGLKFSDPVDLLSYRFSSAFIILVVLYGLGLIKICDISWKKIKQLLLLSIFYPLFFFFFQAWGMQYSSSSEAGIIFAITPVVTSIVARYFLKEKVNTTQIIGILLSVVGIIYIIFHKIDFRSYTQNIQGILFLILSVLSMVTYYILGKKLINGFSAMDITIGMTFVGFIFFNSWSIINHTSADTMNDFTSLLFNTEFIWAILYLGILSSFLTSFLSNFALQIIPAYQISIFNNLNPIIAVVGGVIFLKEKLYSYHIIGGILVLMGVMLTLIFKPKPKIENDES